MCTDRDEVRDGARVDAPADFTSVALAFLAERDEHTGETLGRYLARYPRYAADLTRLAFETAAAEGEARPARPAALPATLFAQLREDARAALDPQRHAPEARIEARIAEAPVPGAAAAPALTSLLARGREQAGLAPRALAQQLDIGVDVLALIEERHVRADTVPVPFLARVAEVLGTTIGAVRAYLAQPPLSAAPGVAYHAPRGHVPARTLTFAEAIGDSNLMTPEQKARWLAQEPGG